jgi:putative membrane protein
MAATLSAAPAAPASRPASAAAAHAKPAAQAVNAQDRQFVQAFGSAGPVARDAASLAVVRTQDPRVRAYAQQATRDWTVADAQLAALARQSGIALPPGSDPTRQAKRRRLEANPTLPSTSPIWASRSMTIASTPRRCRRRWRRARNAGLRSFAMSTWSLVVQHDQQARAVAQALGAQVTAPPLAPPAVAAPAVAVAAPPPAAVPAKATVNAQDRRFVQSLGAGGLAEIDAATLAAARAHDPQVRLYAQQVAKERAAVNAQLAGVAAQAGIAMPAAIDGGHLPKRQRLDAAAPIQFDYVYLTGELDDHQETIQWLEAERSMGQDASLRAFAAATLPIAMQHFQQARALVIQVAGGLPPGLAAVANDTRALRK